MVAAAVLAAATSPTPYTCVFMTFAPSTVPDFAGLALYTTVTPASAAGAADCTAPSVNAPEGRSFPNASRTKVPPPVPLPSRDLPPVVEPPGK